jgi:hypothetical protein
MGNNSSKETWETRGIPSKWPDWRLWGGLCGEGSLVTLGTLLLLQRNKYQTKCEPLWPIYFQRPHPHVCLQTPNPNLVMLLRWHHPPCLLRPVSCVQVLSAHNSAAPYSAPRSSTRLPSYWQPPSAEHPKIRTFDRITLEIQLKMDHTIICLHL